MLQIIFIVLLASTSGIVFAKSNADSKNTNELLTATEMILPRYQSLSLDKDFPASNLILDGSTLYIAGRRSIWKWNLKGKALRRINLFGKKEKGQLKGLTTDGISIMTAYDKGVFRVRKNPLRVLKYTHPMAVGGKTIALTGQSDKILWVHSKAIMNVDRYGQTLIPRFVKTGLKPGDKVLHDSIGGILWISRGNTIRRAVIGATIKSPEVVFESKKKILGIHLAGSQLMAHTARSVIRLNQEGKHLQSIPVTGSRELATMQILGNSHSYLFSDGLLEIFNLTSRTSRRYKLPLENARNAVLGVGEGVATVIDDGIPRAFSLSQRVN